jgi:hypothetical protein
MYGMTARWSVKQLVGKLEGELNGTSLNVEGEE